MMVLREHIKKEKSTAVVGMRIKSTLIVSLRPLAPPLAPPLPPSLIGYPRRWGGHTVLRVARIHH